MLSKFIDTLEYLNHLIRIEGTGDPKTLSRRLDISVRGIYNYVSCLKEMGAPIAYSRHKQTYYYTESVDFLCRFEPFTENSTEAHE
jgi:predicted DNA-binding transcriptional regulator YafY